MNQKEFKQLIREHKVKQDFAYVCGKPTYNKTIIRVYKTTDKYADKQKFFKVSWSVEEHKLFRKITEITSEEAAEYWNYYHEDCLRVRNKMKEQVIALINDCIIKQVGIPSEPVTMEERKFYKQLAVTLTFQLKDKRI